MDPMIRRDARHAIDNAHLILNREFTETDKEDHHYPVQNISRGGLRFSSSDNYDVDERIEITVLLQNREIHRAHARICYRTNGQDQTFHYGVSFLDRFVDMEQVK